MSTPSGNGDAALRLEDLRKVYGGRFGRTVEALKGISLTIEKGEIFGLLGPNGAGKTTTVKLMLGLIKPTRGSAEVLGEAAGSVAALRRLGYLAESSRLPYHMTGRRALHYFAALSGVPRALRAKRADEWLERVGLAAAGDEKIATYSKGMGQRIGLAQALIHDPELIILDEPTDGLDPNQKKMIQDLIASLSSDKSIILSTHILDEAERVCNRALILSQGRILVDSTPAELIARAPDHNVVYVSFSGEVPGALVGAIERQDWCESASVTPDGRLEVRPREGENRLAAVLELLHGQPIRDVDLHQGRLDDLFRDITKGVAA